GRRDRYRAQGTGGASAGRCALHQAADRQQLSPGCRQPLHLEARLALKPVAPAAVAVVLREKPCIECQVAAAGGRYAAARGFTARCRARRRLVGSLTRCSTREKKPPFGSARPM